MSELPRQIHELMEREARQVLAAGWAELREVDAVTGPTFHLEPIKLTAAPLEVHFDSDELLVCYPGRNNMVVEFLSEDPEEMKRQVQALAAAVVDGTYGERVKKGTTEVEAEWPGPDGKQRAAHRLVQVPGTAERRWRPVGYERY